LALRWARERVPVSARRRGNPMDFSGAEEPEPRLARVIGAAGGAVVGALWPGHETIYRAP